MSTAHQGSRRRATQRPGMRPDAPLVAGLVLVVLAGLAVLLTTPARVEEPGRAGVRSAGALVEHTVFACPDEPPARGVDTTVAVGLAATPGASPAADGTVREGPLDEVPGSPLEITRGELVGVDADGGPAVDGVGGAAAGLFGGRTDSGGRTLSAAPCVAPRAQWWFTGAGAGLDHSSSLLLANLDPGPAVVDLRVLGPDGEVDTVATTGITIAPHTVHRVDLADVAPQTDELAVGVHASRGRVAAHVLDGYRDRPTGRPGTEWLAGTELPSRSLRLSGLPTRPRPTTLLVANPSDLEAVVELRVAGESGTFAPTGLEPVTVAPGAVTSVDIGAALPRREGVSLRLRSQVPVTASARIVVPGDHAYAVPVQPLVGPAAAMLPPRADRSVQLTAGAVAARVAVTAYDADGRRVDAADLTIDPTATQTWAPERRAAYVVVAPSAGAGSGTVHGAVVSEGRGLAVTPLSTLPLRVQRPVVRATVR
jgi:hypothetical protein